MGNKFYIKDKIEGSIQEGNLMYPSCSIKPRHYKYIDYLGKGGQAKVELV